MAVGAIDIAKGSLAVLLTKLALDSVAAEMVSGVLVVAGHNWPVFLRLRGGRGAATAVGVLIAALPLLTIPVGIVSLVILWITKKATLSLASCLLWSRSCRGGPRWIIPIFRPDTPCLSRS